MSFSVLIAILLWDPGGHDGRTNPSQGRRGTRHRDLRDPADGGAAGCHDSFFYLVFFWISLSTSWALLSGFAGYFSLGHAAFFGVGMYTTATLTTKADMPFLATVPLAAAMAALLGVGIGTVVFPHETAAGRAVRAADARGYLRDRHDHPQHADRRRRGVFMSAVPLLT